MNTVTGWMLMLDVVQVSKNDVRKIQLIPSDWLLFTNEISKENVAISGTEAPPTCSHLSQPIRSKLKGRGAKMTHKRWTNVEKYQKSIKFVKVKTRNNKSDRNEACVSHLFLEMTSSWIYCSRNGEALKLSTGMLKKPWISFWWRSMVMRWVRPTQTWSCQLVTCLWFVQIMYLKYYDMWHWILSCLLLECFKGTDSPALHIIDATSLDTMEPLFLILHCLL